MDPNTLELPDAAAFWVMNLLPADSLPEVATRALVDGHDSVSLRRLAGESERSRSVLDPLWQLTLRELGIPFPSRPSAQQTVARYYARQIVQGTVTPYEGARRIWWDAANDAFPQNTPSPVWNQLSAFVYLASEWEDDPGRREAYEAEIREKAVQLLSMDAA